MKQAGMQRDEVCYAKCFIIPQLAEDEEVKLYCFSILNSYVCLGVQTDARYACLFEVIFVQTLHKKWVCSNDIS